jgi:outer membrane lipoprotein-sorting protein
MKRLIGAACAAVLLAGAVRADDEAALREVIARAVKAQGGADAVAKVNAAVFRYKGKYHLGDQAIDTTGTISFQLPDRRRIEVVSEFMGREFKYVEVVDGDKGYVVLSGKTEAMAKEQLAESKEQLHELVVTKLTPLQGKEFSLSPLGESKVGGREAVGVRVAHKGRRDVNLYFDKKDGLLLKSETRARDLLADKEYTSETFYSDYKKVGDVLIAHKIEIKRDGVLTIETDATEFKAEPKLDDAVFARP